MVWVGGVSGGQSEGVGGACREKHWPLLVYFSMLSQPYVGAVGTSCDSGLYAADMAEDFVLSGRTRVYV